MSDLKIKKVIGREILDSKRHSDGVQRYSIH